MDTINTTISIQNQKYNGLRNIIFSERTPIRIRFVINKLQNRGHNESNT